MVGTEPLRIAMGCSDTLRAVLLIVAAAASDSLRTWIGSGSAPASLLLPGSEIASAVCTIRSVRYVAAANVLSGIAHVLVSCGTSTNEPETPEAMDPSTAFFARPEDVTRAAYRSWDATTLPTSKLDVYFSPAKCTYLPKDSTPVFWS